MAKKKTAAETAAETAAAAPAAKGRAVVLPNGKRRIDYCREQYAKGVSRSDIAKALTEMCGTKIPYQVVFAATKVEKPEEAAEAK